MQGDVRPDHVVLLDAPVETGMARAKQRGELDRFEQETVSFFQRIRDTYLARAAIEPARYNIVDASASLEQVSARISELMCKFQSDLL